MECIKTGFIARIGFIQYAHGDAFVIWPNSHDTIQRVGDNCAPNGTLLLRISATTFKKPKRIHIDVPTFDRWFDEFRFESNGSYRTHQPNATLIADAGQWNWLSYEGVDL